MDKSTKILLPFYITFMCNGICYYGATGSQVTILDSLTDPINGLIPQAVMYAAGILGPISVAFFLDYFPLKFSMAIWSLCQASLSAALIYPTQSAIYVSSAIGGWSGSMSCSLGSVVIARVSSKFDSSEARNTGNWNLFLMSGILWSNLAVSLIFKGNSIISDEDRYSLMIPLTVVGLLGCISSLFFEGEQFCEPSQCSVQTTDVAAKKKLTFKAAANSQWTEIKEMVWSLGDFKAICLYSTGVYCGLECSFCSGVTQSAVGNSLYIKNSKEVMGLVGLGIGVGEIFGSLVYSAFSRKEKDNGIFTVLYVCAGLIGYYILFLILPSDSIQGETNNTPYYSDHSEVLSISVGFLLGFADCVVYCQFTAIFCRVFKDKQNISVYFAVQYVAINIGAALFFVVSDRTDLYWQLVILAISTVGSCFVMFGAEFHSFKPKPPTSTADDDDMSS